MSATRGPEWDLIEAAQAGDRDAFGRLYAQYSPKVTRVLQAQLQDHSLAEDLTSETFFRALRGIDSVSYQLADPGAWLTTIARNLVRDHWRSSRYRREHPTADISDSPSAQEGPEAAVIRQDTATDLHRRVAQLPEDQRECVRSRFLRELSVAETAARMGRSENAVKGLTHRGLQRLRASMMDNTQPPVPIQGPAPQPQSRPDDADGTPDAPRAVEVGDSLVAARRALAQLRGCQNEREQRAAQQRRADQLARWHTEDHTPERARDTIAEPGLSPLPSDGARP